MFGGQESWDAEPSVRGEVLGCGRRGWSWAEGGPTREGAYWGLLMRPQGSGKREGALGPLVFS